MESCRYSYFHSISLIGFLIHVGFKMWGPLHWKQHNTFPPKSPFRKPFWRFHCQLCLLKIAIGSGWLLCPPSPHLRDAPFKRHAVWKWMQQGKQWDNLSIKSLASTLTFTGAGGGVRRAWKVTPRFVTHIHTWELPWITTGSISRPLLQPHWGTLWVKCTSTAGNEVAASHSRTDSCFLISNRAHNGVSSNTWTYYCNLEESLLSSELPWTLTKIQMGERQFYLRPAWRCIFMHGDCLYSASR